MKESFLYWQPLDWQTDTRHFVMEFGVLCLRAQYCVEQEKEAVKDIKSDTDKVSTSDESSEGGYEKVYD